MIKLFSLISGLFTATNHGSSFVSSIMIIFGYIGRFFVNAFSGLLNVAISASWNIIKFVLGLMEAFEYMINSFIGIKTVQMPNGSYELRGTTIQDMVDYAEGVSNGSATSFVTILANTFKALMGVAIVLLIIFTIVAMIKQEYAHATSGSADPEGNNKKPIIMGMFKRMLYVFLLPLTMMFILTGVNSILAAFSRAMQGEATMTVASQLLASSTYDSNKYRYYAQQGRRIPIIIRAYDPNKYQPDENEILMKKISSGEVQAKLKATASAIATNTTLTWAESVKYENNKLVNSTEYGDYYEKFVCTGEQYQIMADFIDYAQKTRVSFQVKSINDPNIDWCYVDSVIFNPSDVSLKINYRDASDINGNGKTSDSYVMEFSSSFEVTTPISDAMETIMALLGIGDYSDYLYKTMERDEDYLNVVQWQKEKVFIQLSEDFEVDSPSEWTRMDQLIMYEYYHFASNNTFGKYTIDDLKEGVELDAAQISYREYYPEANAYSPIRTMDCVKINGSYYRTVQDPYKTDKYGNIYYILYEPLAPTDTLTFLNQEYATITRREDKTAKLKLSNGFDINDKSTWKYTDEILIYEFYKDLTYNNQLYSYNFEDFKSGVDVNVYRITHNRLDETESDNKDLNGNYVLINGTYYKVTDDTFVLYGLNSNESFLSPAGTYEDTYYYNFNIELDDPIYANQYGISTDIDSELAANKFYYVDTEAYQATYKDVQADDPMLEKYSSFSLKFSENFTYQDVDTWTYKDYFLFYLYLNHTKIAGNLGLESLRISGVNGQIVKATIPGAGENYYFQVKYGKVTDSKDLYLYIDMDKVSKISNFIINKTLNHTLLLQTNLRGDYVDLFVNAQESKLLETETELVEFKFSDGFDQSFPSKWTVLDYILYTFSKNNIISPVDEIKSKGYNALLYKTAFDDETTSNVDETEFLYRFGSKTNDATKYLSLQGVRALKNIAGESLNFDNIYEFLNTKLIDYVSVLYNTNNAQLITDEYGIIDNLYGELTPYIHDVEYIINRILEAKGFNFSGNTFEVYDNIAEITYKSTAKFEDLSTWTSFDSVMYYLTKTFRTSYKGNVILYGSDQYFVYGNYAIKITNSGTNPFKATISENNVITSKESRITGADSVAQYYKDNYSNYVYLESDLGNKITKYATTVFTYTKKSTTKTELDVVYEALTRSAISNGESKTFEAFSDGDRVYLKLAGKDLADIHTNVTYYISVSTDYNKYISALVESELNFVNNTKIATKTGTYAAFNNTINAETDISALNFTKLDALIFRDLGLSEKKTYNVYTMGADSFIYTGNSYIRYDASTIAQRVESFDAIDDDTDKNFIKELFNKYYKRYVKTSVDNITFDEKSTTYKFTQIGTSNITKLTPIAIILSSLGVFDITMNSYTVTGHIGRTSKYTYFHYRDTVNGEVLDFYIDITNIAETYYEPGNTDIQLLRDIAEIKYQMVFNYLLEKEPSLTTNLNTFEEKLDTAYNSYKVDKINCRTTISNLNSLNLRDATTWNYLNILYHNLSGESSLASLQFVYLDESGNRYIKVESDAKSYYIKIGTNAGYDTGLTTTFTSTNVNYTLKDGDNYSSIGIIAYKLLGTETGSIKFITVDNSIDLEFYFISNDSGSSTNTVYGLGDSPIRSAITEGYYTYNFSGDAGVNDWTLFDAIVAITRNSSAQNTLRSNIHIYGNNAYIIVNGRYLNLSKLGLLSSADVTDIFNKINSNLDVGGVIPNNTQKLNSYFNSTTDGYKALITCDDEPVALPEPDDAPAAATNDVQLKFSENFKLDDYKTWMLSDYILFYMFHKHPDYFRYDPDNAIENFNDLANQGYAPGKYWKYLDEDEFGNTELQEIYFIGVKERNDQTILAVDAAVFRLCYSRIVVGLERDDAFAQGVGPVTFEISSAPTGVVPGNGSYPNRAELNNLSLPKNVAMNSNDFIFDDYYYFSITKFGVVDSLQNTSDSTISKINKGTATTTKAINIALSSGFDIKNRATWTWLDFIIVYEFSNTAVRHNYFEGVEFEDLKIESYLPVFEESNEAVIEINGNYYNLLAIGYTDDDDTVFNQSDIDKIRNSKTLKDPVGTVSAVKDFISKGSDKSFNIKTLYDSTDYYVKMTNDYTLDYSKTPDSIMFSKSGKVTFMTVNTNIIQQYNINIKKLNCGDNYSITTIVRQVNWPQKLMNDMQVIYPDLNWATLIATDGWLDMLGEFTSAQSSGEFVSEGNSANITAAGLVLSEFFVSVAKENKDVEIDRAYEYTPVYNEDVIRSLMLSMLGEEEYNDLSMQGTVFIEMFNNMFLPVLDDIAKERGEEIVDGKVDSFYISIYKAYLATLLLGSDMGEYFYKIATRVYSQYTILDALASASGDYAAYLDYINSLSSESGGAVSAFKYSSFHELCIYENSFTGNSNPTFTFNFEKTLKGLYGEEISYSSLVSKGYTITDMGLTASDKVDAAGAKKVLANANNFKKVLTELNDKYSQVYMTNNSRISDLNTTGYYCFMIDAYWSIKQDLKRQNKADPVYLEIYYEYITGTMKRWIYSDSVSTDAASGFIPDYDDYIKQRKKTNKATIKAALGIYIPDLDQIDVEEEGSLWDKLSDLLSDSVITSWTVLGDTFDFEGSQFTDAKRAYKNIIDKKDLISTNDLTEIKSVMAASENGDSSLKYKNLVGFNKYENVDAWQRLNSIHSDISVLTRALKEVMKLNPGEYYVVDGVKVAYKDPDYKDGRFSKAYTELLDLNDALGNYISSQQTLDIVNKTCITFTLAQFGKNYVTDGYTFSFENRSYTMKSTASPERLAEYVYGGAYLAKYGVPASYTNDEFNGFIESYRVYDSEIKSLRTRLNVWPELRSFASELANYTSRLYYLSNMNDLANNVGDGILLTDFVNDGIYSLSDGLKTLEHIILNHLIDSDLAADTLLRLSFGDSVETLDALGCAVNEVYALAHYLEGTSYKMTEDDDGNEVIAVGSALCPIIIVGETEYEMTSSFKRNAIKRYLNLVADDAFYDSDGYYNEGTDSGAERIHKIFKKTISYLIVTEEEGETVSENAVNLDNINFKQFRQILMKALSDYQKNPTESDLENQNRYITLFNLVNSQFDHTYHNGTEVVNAGTSISTLYLKKVSGVMNHTFTNSLGEINNAPIYSTLSTDTATKDIVLHLAGVENRPIEELVGLEYDNLYDRNGNYDEETGDVFILTTYDDAKGKYYPIMGRSNKSQITGDNKVWEYISEYGIDFKTKYYHTDNAYPIVAKGVIDAVGYPTAIKMVDNEIIYYRTSITTSGSVSEEALSRTRKSAEVTTVGYTKYVDLSYAKPKSLDSMAMFAGSTSMEYAVQAGFDPKFIQIEEAYTVSDPENFDSIMVLDKFSAFYTLEIKQYFMFMLGFATLIPILFKATAQVLRRILDLILLIMAGPVVIATMQINPDQSGKGNKIFDTWKNNLSDTLLHVFGYMIAFNIYYILVSTVMGMDFVSDATMQVLDKVGGLTSILSESSINSMITYVYVVAAAGTIETSADLLVNIVTCGKSQKAFSTNMSGEVFADIKKMVTEVREIYDAVSGIASGQALTQLKDFAMQSAKNFIPGGQLVAGMIQKGQNIATDIKAKGLEKSAVANGMSPAVAKKMSKQFADNEKGQRDQKRQNSANNANQFLKTTLGTGPMFEETKSFTPSGGDETKKPKAPKKPKGKKKGKGGGKKKK